MKFYQEITLLPDAEISLSFIWQNVFQQVHIALVESKIAVNQSEIAVSFPLYKKHAFPLGNKLRLFAANQEILQKLDIAKWLLRLSDYVHLKSIQEVPENCGYVRFSRKRVKSESRVEKDMQDKARLWASKSGLSVDECLERLAATKPDPHCKWPFIFLHSQTTKQLSLSAASKFPLFVQMEKLDTAEIGEFDCYGLSKHKKGGIPHF